MARPEGAMRVHKLLSGEYVSYALGAEPPGSDAHLSLLMSRVDDPSVGMSAFLDLVFGCSSPLVGRSGSMPKSSLELPEAQVVLDLIARKKLSVSSTDEKRVDESFTMSVADAAAAAGVHGSAIRQAIASGKLSSVKRKGVHRLDPAQVAAYRPTAAGPSPSLTVMMGSAPRVSLSVKHDGEMRTVSRAGDLLDSRLERWTSAAVISRVDGNARFWEIEPGSALEEISALPAYVRGRFRIVARSNNPRESAQLFKAFKPGRKSP